VPATCGRWATRHGQPPGTTPSLFNPLAVSFVYGVCVSLPCVSKKAKIFWFFGSVFTPVFGGGSMLCRAESIQRFFSISSSL